MLILQAYSNRIKVVNELEDVINRPLNVELCLIDILDHCLFYVMIIKIRRKQTKRNSIEMNEDEAED